MERILDNFINLTKYTVPSGKEEEIYQLLDTLCPYPLTMDNYGNKYLIIGESSTLFISHLDTVGYKKMEVKHIITPTLIKTDGSTILGGDNKAGVSIMIEMIHNNIPGHYWFVRNEEIGCLGSSYIRDKTPDMLIGIKRAISFDRRDRSSVVTFMRNRRCCSDEFANELIFKLKETTKMPWHKDPTGISADTASFMDIIPECVNISAGVWREHTNEECLDIEWFLKLSKAVIKIDWESLNSYRDFTRIEPIPTPIIECEDYGIYNKVIEPDNLKYSNIIYDAPTPEDLLEIWNFYNPDEMLYSLSEEESEEIYPVWKERYINYLTIDNLMSSFSFYPTHKINLLQPITYLYIKGKKSIVVNIKKNGKFTFNRYPITDKKIAIRFIESTLEKGSQLSIPLKNIIEIKEMKFEVDNIEVLKDEIKCSISMDELKFYVYFSNSSKPVFRKLTKEKGQTEMLYDVIKSVELESLKLSLHKEAMNRMEQFITPSSEPVYTFKKKRKLQQTLNFDEIVNTHTNTNIHGKTDYYRNGHYHNDYWDN